MKIYYKLIYRQKSLISRYTLKFSPISYVFMYSDNRKCILYFSNCHKFNPLKFKSVMLNSDCTRKVSSLMWLIAIFDAFMDSIAKLVNVTTSNSNSRCTYIYIIYPLKIVPDVLRIL